MSQTGLWHMQKYKLNSSADIWSLAMKRDTVFPLFNGILCPLWKEACLLKKVWHIFSTMSGTANEITARPEYSSHRLYELYICQGKPMLKLTGSFCWVPTCRQLCAKQLKQKQPCLLIPAHLPAPQRLPTHKVRISLLLVGHYSKRACPYYQFSPNVLSSIFICRSYVLY